MVKGTITGKTGKPLKGVVVKTKNNEVVSDDNGVFTIDAQPNEQIQLFVNDLELVTTTAQEITGLIQLPISQEFIKIPKSEKNWKDFVRENKDLLILSMSFVSLCASIYFGKKSLDKKKKVTN